MSAFVSYVTGWLPGRRTGSALPMCAMAPLDPQKKRVVVSGASGKTGRLILQKALDLSVSEEPWQVLGLVRDETARANLVSSIPGCTPENVQVADIRDSQALKRVMSPRTDALIIATSAVPKIKPLSILKVLVGKVIGQKYAPEFTFKLEQSPKEVDYEAQLNQINAAKEAGVEHVVLLGSAGGTGANQFLNTIGNGNILVWKRRAEKYLINSGIKYTVIHAGGLMDKEGGKRQLIATVDDIIESVPLQESKTRTVTRADVATVCVEALRHPEYVNRSFDLFSKENGEVTTDYAKLLRDLKGNSRYAFPVDEQDEKEGYPNPR
ncbi:Uncharacterized protein FVE85_4733 [Porphyridium purpureum]|uniref:NAD(P)-binding domain-containing protein n=1 Tax=Porphyridium purpureum TaxID=35688 RepID=A0A5J4YQQ3_PORPP|nr:Uncharacterized protein FVE85_4733 [Porphyridium purpureum]|eukprot:POR6361..scf236_6